MLTVKNLSFAYPKQKPLLTNVSFELAIILPFTLFGYLLIIANILRINIV